MFTSVELKNMKFKENVRKIVSHKEVSENLREIFIFIEFFCKLSISKGNFICYRKFYFYLENDSYRKILLNILFL